ncbi:hypothetical protein [Williamsoniiplasma lucivorax]|uniref:Uncharacterized protein n=1 Tax=Williamsoniiplasma lucivorax TaxID=209274 RepID=A0A2S5RDW1_9MOLU|nr:hypothetical protein [Williamsoniiplasma lucivorax]PPE05487.1 hypothetical protein ELUCI_v1c05800 [Williamsoniiplasma lucivorax]
MQILEYLFGFGVSILVIASFFIFHKFWAKTTKTYWVRIIVAGWMIGNQIWLGTYEGHWINFEICHILAWSTVVLMFIPNKLQVELFLPLVMVGPVLSIAGGIVAAPADAGFAHFRYWNYYFAHLGIMVGYLYIYLFDFTGACLNWKMLKRSGLFAVCLLTFIMVWNMAHVPAGHNPLKPVPVGEDVATWWGSNDTYKHIFGNIGLGYLSLLVQYFLMMFVFGPAILVLCWTAIFFARPIYAYKGTEKLKFNIHDEVLGIKKHLTKKNFKNLLKFSRQKQ